MESPWTATVEGLVEAGLLTDWTLTSAIGYRHALSPRSSRMSAPTPVRPRPPPLRSLLSSRPEFGVFRRRLLWPRLDVCCPSGKALG
jgi:hypothetical protein